MGEIRIYTDESVDVAIAEGLQRRGVEVISARDCDKLGFADEEQLIFAGEKKATIFTHDTDFLRISAQGKYGTFLEFSDYSISLSKYAK